jgi:hypothetical protein
MAMRDRTPAAFRAMIRDRLERALDVLGRDRETVCRDLPGWTAQKLSNWLSPNQTTLIPMYELYRFCRKYGFRPDWFFFNDDAHLPKYLADGLAAAQAGKPAVEPEVPDQAPKRPARVRSA